MRKASRYLSKPHVMDNIHLFASFALKFFNHFHAQPLQIFRQIYLFRKGYFLIALIFLTSCQTPRLSIYKEYVAAQNLPSFIIGTPDPALCDPDIGEKLHISWTLHSSPPATLRLSLKFFSGAYEQVDMVLEERSGVFVYPLLNAYYLETGGILSYRVELFEEGVLVKDWCHQLWVEPLDQGSYGK